jgi:hypothetical protein
MGTDLKASRMIPRFLDSAESVGARAVSGNFFNVRRAPRLGRGFTIADERDACVAIASDAAWQRLFRADFGVIGRGARGASIR